MIGTLKNIPKTPNNPPPIVIAKITKRGDKPTFSLSILGPK